VNAARAADLWERARDLAALTGDEVAARRVDARLRG
jgi:hypothetical protein